MLSLLLGPAGNVKVNSQAINGLTALHLAAQENHLPIAHVLLDHSCIIDPQTKVIYPTFHLCSCTVLSIVALNCNQCIVISS